MFKNILVSMIAAAALVAGHAAAQALPNTLGKIKAAKAINVAYSPETLPFSYKETDGQPAGYSIDLCKRIIAQIGRAVGEPNLKVNWLAGSERPEEKSHNVLRLARAQALSATA